MNNETIERVARSICVSMGLEPDFNYDPKGISDGVNIRWRLFIPQAEAAIEALDFARSPIPKPLKDQNNNEHD